MTSFLTSLSPILSLTASTIPTNGNLNPYGVAIVPKDFPRGGLIKSSDILVSNFNNSGNLQGTGTTIIAVNPTTGGTFTFFSAPPLLGPVGLTTALEVLDCGIVVVGNTPTTDGTFATLRAGSLIFIDPFGQVLLNYVHPLIQGPWDMTVVPMCDRQYKLYVSNVLNGTIIQLYVRAGKCRLHVDDIRLIAVGFGHRPDPAALMIGPTGLVWYKNKLYVADTLNNRIQVLALGKSCNPLGTGVTLYAGSPLQGPLGLSLSPEATLIVANGDAINSVGVNNNLVELDRKTGHVIATLVPPFSPPLTPGTSGALFGITIEKIKSGKSGKSLVYVDDINNAVNVLSQV